MRLQEWAKKGKAARSDDHDMLYHLTSHHGYAFTIDQNALISSDGVCTTWNPNMNKVEGRDHNDFKFVLDKKLIDDYGAHHYVDHFQYAGQSRKWHAFKEDEIRLNTKKVEPFNEYLIGTVLMFDLFSEKGIQWLLYMNSDYSSFFGTKKSAAPRAIDTLFKQVYEWKKPVWKREVGVLLDKQELMFLKDAHRISKRGGTFKDGMIALCKKYPIIGHWGKPLDSITAKRQFLGPKLVQMLNGYYVGRDRKDIKIPQVKRLIERILRTIGIGNNAIAIIMHEIEQAGLFHVMTPPVVWSSVFRHAMEGDIDETIMTVKFLGKREQSTRDWHDNSSDDSFIRSGEHYGTMFGRSSVEG